ncbi:MAG: baseplate J/gp47 family protein [Acetobacter sp.]|nr:baseplate J/gp47 family protein [Bacteroides sp.]MCM1341731.1 baseplate J/gp47 family protein [Acetobacter sp.]MCM1432330.1 baseplate J/gp47 family protein [Clostridiales bacterium]
MSRTKDEIFDEMKQYYSSLCKEKLDKNSVQSRIMEALATEIYAIYCYSDYIFNQAFAHTATGEYLDKQADLRGLTRKTPSKAAGTLTFYINEPVDYDIEISNNVICSAADKPYLQYITDNACVIPAGETSASVDATAISTGIDFNVNAGEITVMVNAPVGISKVSNEHAFTGGYDTEDDESLRYRIINHYRYSPNGVSSQFMENAVLDLDFVTDCFIPRTDNYGEITVYVSTKTGSLSDDEKAQVTDALAISELVGAVVDVVNAQLDDFVIDVNMKIRQGYTKDKITKHIDKFIEEEYANSRIGRAFSLKNIERRALTVDGVLDVALTSDKAISDTVYCEYSKKLNLKEVKYRSYAA